MSRLTMRPPGPEPCIVPRSTPRSEARRRARGDERTRPPLPWLALGAGCCAPGPGDCAGAPAAFCCGGIDASPCDCAGVRGTLDAPALSCALPTTCSAGFAAGALEP